MKNFRRIFQGWIFFLALLSGCSLQSPQPPEQEQTPAPSVTTGGGLQSILRNAPAPTPRPCVDTLAGVKYVSELSAIPKHFGIGFFAQTFGDAFPVVKKELEEGREKIRVNLIWSDPHSFGDKDIPTVEKESRRYEPLCQRFPGRVELAPFTEHNVSQPDKYLNIAQANAPNCRIVNSIWKGGLSRKYKNEVHGTHAAIDPPYNYSFDGTNAVDSDFKAMQTRHSKAEMFCSWFPRDNLRWRMKDATPRPQRKARATKDTLRSEVYLFSPKGTFNIPGKWLVKSHAENHGPDKNGNPDTKGDKLLIISPIRSLDAKKKFRPIILKRDGKEVGKLAYYGPYDGGGYRYYGNQMGFKYGAELAVTIGGKVYGTINGGFRGPTFR